MPNRPRPKVSNVLHGSPDGVSPEKLRELSNKLSRLQRQWNSEKGVEDARAEEALRMKMCPKKFRNLDHYRETADFFLQIH